MSSPGLKVPERHSDTEEATGSNPVRPTRFLEILSSAESRDGSQAPAVLRNKRWSRRWHSGLCTRRPGGFGQLEAHSRGCHRVRQPCSIPDVTYGQRGTACVPAAGIPAAGGALFICRSITNDRSGAAPAGKRAVAGGG